MNLDLNGILDYQQNRYPYLMIDHATKIIPGKLSEGYKILKRMSGFLRFIGLLTQNAWHASD